jgi:hypothetical protein
MAHRMTSLVTLIPAYKPAYLADLLTCLRTQTRRPDLVIISDDSPDGAFTKALAMPEAAVLADGLDIEVVPGPRRGAYPNVRHLVACWAGSSDFVHVLLDDDVIYPEFYERHLAAHDSARRLVSVSRRWRAQENGIPVGEGAMPTAITASGRRLLEADAGFVFGTTLPSCHNWLGEFSNAVLRAEAMGVVDEPVLGGVPTSGLEDLGLFLAASLEAPLAILNEHLGFFRVNPGQNTRRVMSPLIKAAHLAWPAMAIAARRLDRLDEAGLRGTIERMGQIVIRGYGTEPDMAEACQALRGLLDGAPGAEDRYLDVWQRFSAGVNP